MACSYEARFGLIFTGATACAGLHIISTMQFLMADGTVQDLADVMNAEIENHRLVCRDRDGNIVTSFERLEVIAFGWKIGEALDGRTDRRKRRGRQ